MRSCSVVSDFAIRGLFDPMDGNPPGSSIHGILWARNPLEWVAISFSRLDNLWNSAFRCVYLSFHPLPFSSLLFLAISKPPADNHFAFLHFFFLGMVSLFRADWIFLWHGNWLSPEQLMPERDKVEATVSFMTQHWKSHSHFCSLLICEPYLFSMEGTTQRWWEA